MLVMGWVVFIGAVVWVATSPVSVGI
jgi:hypothetical protein